MPATVKRLTQRIPAGLVLAVLALGPISLAASPAEAQGRPSLCTARNALLSQLKSQYGEEPVAIGVADGALVELLTAKDGITWTIILTSPKGVSCLVASGDGWRPLLPIADGPAV